MIDLGGVIALIMMIFLLVLGAVGFGAYLANWYLTRDDVEEDQPQAARSDYDDFENDEEEMPALKVDPEDPPTWKVYRGQAGPFCNCHERRIEYGENILMWPDPEKPGAFRLFHEDFVKGMVPPRA